MSNRKDKGKAAPAVAADDSTSQITTTSESDSTSGPGTAKASSSKPKKAAATNAISSEDKDKGRDAGKKAIMSGDLKYRPMRLYSRRVKARPILNRILNNSVFIYLEDDDQALVREQAETCIRDDIDKFFDESAPRALYPYEERVLAAVRTVFMNNLSLFSFGEDEYAIGQVHDSKTYESEHQEQPNKVDESVLDELFF